jgi:phage recombination protein Bet
MGALTTRTQPAIVATMAGKYSIDPSEFEVTLRATIVPKTLTNEELAVFLLVADRYGLNPLMRQIYAMPKKGGGIQPVVAVDGWYSMANDQPQFDGIEFEDRFDDKGAFSGVTCRVWRKDRTRPTDITEWLSECRMNTDPWAKWPRRMMRHKAGIQALRIAFGFSDIVDPDEAARFTQAEYAPPRHLHAIDVDDGMPKSNSARAIEASAAARARHIEAEALKPALEDDEIPDFAPVSRPVISHDQVAELLAMAGDAGVDAATICKRLDVAGVADIPAEAFAPIMRKLKLTLKKIQEERGAQAKADFTGDADDDIIEADGPAQPEDERHAAFRAGWAAQCKAATRIPPVIMRKQAAAWLKGYDAAQQAVDIGVMPDDDDSAARALDATVARAFL